MQHSATTATGKVFGAAHAHAKMTSEKAAELRRLRQQFGMTYRALGGIFGIDHKTARSIATGLTWVSMPGKIVFRADDAELGQIRAMVAAGTGLKKAAATLGVTERSVRRLMEKHGIRALNPPPGRKAECKHGHPLNGPNLRVTPDGKFVCRECTRQRARKYSAGKRAKERASA